jgi:hypothetical protein
MISAHLQNVLKEYIMFIEPYGTRYSLLLYFLTLVSFVAHAGRAKQNGGLRLFSNHNICLFIDRYIQIYAVLNRDEGPRDHPTLLL